MGIFNVIDRIVNDPQTALTTLNLVVQGKLIDLLDYLTLPVDLIPLPEAKEINPADGCGVSYTNGPDFNGTQFIVFDPAETVEVPGPVVVVPTANKRHSLPVIPVPTPEPVLLLTYRPPPVSEGKVSKAGKSKPKATKKGRESVKVAANGPAREVKPTPTVTETLYSMVKGKWTVSPDGTHRKVPHGKTHRYQPV